MWQGNRLLTKQLQGNPAPSKSACQGRPKAEETEWSHNLRVSPATTHLLEAVFSIVWGIYGREHDDLWMIWMWKWLFGAYFWMPLFEQQFILDKTVRQLLRETGKLISEQNDITCIKTIDFQDATWMQTRLLCEKVYRFTNAKTYVFSCVGKWEMILLRTGRGKFNGIRKTTTSNRWIEAMECRRSSSGKNSLESQRWTSEKIQKITDRSIVWTGALQR